MQIPDRIPAAVQTEEHSDWMQGQVQAATNNDTAHSSSVTWGLSELEATILPAHLVGSHTASGHLQPTVQQN